MTTDTNPETTPVPAVTFSNVADLAAVTKAPVQVVFDSLAPAGLKEDEVIAVNTTLKAGSVKSALKALFTAGLVAKRNAVTNTRGRPPVLFFKASEAPEIAPKPAKVAKAPKSTPEAGPNPATSFVTAADPIDPSAGNVLVEITG